MALFERLRATFRADAHGLVDALEDRTLLLKQHLRDAEAALLGKRNELADLADREARLMRELSQVTDERRRHDEDAELALSEGRDELAKKALGRALPLAQLTRRLEQAVTEVAKLRAVRAETVVAQEQDLVALRLQVEAYLAARPEHAGSDARYVPEPITDDQIELELLRRKRARDTASASADTERGDVS